jgi:hypothetical protein
MIPAREALSSAPDDIGASVNRGRGTFGGLVEFDRRNTFHIL